MIEMAQMLHKHLSEKGVKLALSERVERFDEDDERISVVTNKRTLPVDMVIMAAGVRPNTQLAAGCGLKIGASGEIGRASCRERVSNDG